jgi:hypothetical protein
MFRISIRDLLWLTVVVALGVGWWNDRRKLIGAHWVTARQLAVEQGWKGRAQALADALRKEGYTVEVTESGSAVYPPPISSAPAPKTPSE